MLKNIILERPLAVFDLETTGTDTKIDRIIEISVLKLLPGGGSDHRTRRVNSGVPIPPESTAVHGISDGDVADCPSFWALAPGPNNSLDATRTTCRPQDDEWNSSPGVRLEILSSTVTDSS